MVRLCRALWREIHIKDLLSVKMIGNGEPLRILEQQSAMPGVDLRTVALTIVVWFEERKKSLAVKEVKTESQGKVEASNSERGEKREGPTEGVLGR